MTAPTGIAPLDLLGIFLVLVLVVLGTVRGLWWQVIRLVGVALAVITARILGASVSALIAGFWPELSSRASNGAAWASIFLITLAAASIFGLLGQRMLEAMKLGLANRTAGALAGALTGLLVHVALLVVLVQLAPAHFLGRHVAGTFSERLYAKVAHGWPVVLGAEAAGEVHRVLEEEQRSPAAPPTNVVR